MNLVLDRCNGTISLTLLIWEAVIGVLPARCFFACIHENMRISFAYFRMSAGSGVEMRLKTCREYGTWSVINLYKTFICVEQENYCILNTL